jgi:hypothetical protein
MASALLALSMFAQGNAAQANWKDVEWCAEDPVIIVFGGQFKVVSTVHASPNSVSSFAYTIEVPSNAVGRTNVSYPNGKFASTTVQVNYTGAAWNGSGAFAVNGSVYVTAADNSDVSVSISGPTVSSATFDGGKANKAFSFSTSVTPGAASDQSGTGSK